MPRLDSSLRKHLFSFDDSTPHSFEDLVGIVREAVHEGSIGDMEVYGLQTGIQHLYIAPPSHLRSQDELDEFFVSVVGGGRFISNPHSITFPEHAVLVTFEMDLLLKAVPNSAILRNFIAEYFHRKDYFSSPYEVSFSELSRSNELEKLFAEHRAIADAISGETAGRSVVADVETLEKHIRSLQKDYLPAGIYRVGALFDKRSRELCRRYELLTHEIPKLSHDLDFTMSDEITDSIESSPPSLPLWLKKLAAYAIMNFEIVRRHEMFFLLPSRNGEKPAYVKSLRPPFPHAILNAELEGRRTVLSLAKLEKQYGETGEIGSLPDCGVAVCARYRNQGLLLV